MIAALLELNHSLTLRAPLPALVFRLSQEFHRLFILGTVPALVRLAAALHTDFGRAFGTLSDLPPVAPMADIIRAYELITVTLGTVDSIAGRVLDEFLVPGLFEGSVKQLIHVVQRDEVLGTAFGWHVLRI